MRERIEGTLHVTELQSEVVTALREVATQRTALRALEAQLKEERAVHAAELEEERQPERERQALTDRHATEGAPRPGHTFRI